MHQLLHEIPLHWRCYDELEPGHTLGEQCKHPVIQLQALKAPIGHGAQDKDHDGFEQVHNSVGLLVLDALLAPERAKRLLWVEHNHKGAFMRCHELLEQRTALVQLSAVPPPALDHHAGALMHELL